MAAYCQVYGVIHCTSPAGWRPVHRDQLWAQRSVPSMGKLYLFYQLKTTPKKFHIFITVANFKTKCIYFTAIVAGLVLIMVKIMKGWRRVPDVRCWVAIAVKQWLRQLRQHWLCVQRYKLLTANLRMHTYIQTLDNVHHSQAQSEAWAVARWQENSGY